MTTGFQINGVDWDDKFVRRDVFTQGGLWTWGTNGYGQLGDNSINNKSSPVQTVAGGSTWLRVGAGSRHALAIKTDGTLWSWGLNTIGQLGDNSITNRSSPVQTVASGNNWKYVSGGGYHTSSIKSDGSLWSWGHNSFGQLGNNNVTHRSSPVQTISGGTNWKMVSCGRYHTGAIKLDGTLWMWGFNILGTLGTNDSTERSSPVQTISGGSNWKSVSCAALHTAALKTDGTLWSWGWNVNGQLGTNNTGERSSPVQTISAGNNWRFVATGFYNTFGVKTDGTLWGWGENSTGQLGDSTTDDKSSPVQTSTFGTNWKIVSAGRYITSGIKTDGTLWMWGNDFSGSLATNTNETVISSPVQTITAGNNWKSAAHGINSTLSIRNDFY